MLRSTALETQPVGLIPLNRVAEPDIERRSRPEAKFAFSSGYVQAATGQAQGCVGGDSAPATNDVVEASSCASAGFTNAEPGRQPDGTVVRKIAPRKGEGHGGKCGG